MISVIIPVYNRENTIERAVDSIRKQSFSDWELLIVDDGSRDRSGEICDRYAQNDRRIKVFHTENCGVSHARNIGLDNARGEWVAFLDSDDEYLPDAFQTMLKYSGDADIVCAAGMYLPTYRIMGKTPLEPVVFSPSSLPSYTYLVNHFCGSACMKLFKRASVNSRFDEELSKWEDLVYSIEAISSVEKTVFIPPLVYKYYLHSPLSVSSGFNPDELRCYIKYYTVFKRCFSEKTVLQWANDKLCHYCVSFFSGIAFYDRLPLPAKKAMIQMYYYDYIEPNAGDIAVSKLKPVEEVLWRAICSGNPEIILREFEQQKEALISFYKGAEENISENEIFCRKLPELDGFWMQAFVIEKGGAGYAFTAAPEEFAEAYAAILPETSAGLNVISDNNAVICFRKEDKKFYVQSVPADDREIGDGDRGIPLQAVCFLEHGAVNEIHRMKAEFAFCRLMHDNPYINRENGELHYKLYREFTEKTVFYSVQYNTDINIAEIVHKELLRAD